MRAFRAEGDFDGVWVMASLYLGTVCLGTIVSEWLIGLDGSGTETPITPAPHPTYFCGPGLS